jgi:hypothetical protein
MTKGEQLKVMLEAIDNKAIVNANRKYLELSYSELQILGNITTMRPPESIEEAVGQRHVIDKITFEIAMRN